MLACFNQSLLKIFPGSRNDDDDRLRWTWYSWIPEWKQALFYQPKDASFRKQPFWWIARYFSTLTRRRCAKRWWIKLDLQHFFLLLTNELLSLFALLVVFFFLFFWLRASSESTTKNEWALRKRTRKVTKVTRKGAFLGTSKQFESSKLLSFRVPAQVEWIFNVSWFKFILRWFVCSCPTLAVFLLFVFHILLPSFLNHTLPSTQENIDDGNECPNAMQCSSANTNGLFLFVNAIIMAV